MTAGLLGLAWLNVSVCLASAGLGGWGGVRTGRGGRLRGGMSGPGSVRRGGPGGLGGPRAGAGLVSIARTLTVIRPLAVSWGGTLITHRGARWRGVVIETFQF